MKKSNETAEKVEETVNETSEVKEEAVRKSGKQPKSNTEILVYCGPTIKGVAAQFAHYNNGLPKKLSEYSQQNKEVKRLIVPVEKLVETKKNIQIKGTIENLTFIKIQKGE
ncbi:hypothetical protein [Anaerocolumna sp. MB42-C2]|uniref:hypothetical protein n=1 Tax=Anaerocolumna sp. MB42-C2 TaxID=3070997 RepID=UPI0027E04C41|nr:hypothetical protein [Anaerocolumna sp. MB42-C2]WMJ88865.1 hypothetical protein RBU59_04930 [Anaerocolumna sp. MB42-C2]